MTPWANKKLCPFGESICVPNDASFADSRLDNQPESTPLAKNYTLNVRFSFRALELWNGRIHRASCSAIGCSYDGLRRLKPGAKVEVIRAENKNVGRFMCYCSTPINRFFTVNPNLTTHFPSLTPSLSFLSLEEKNGQSIIIGALIHLLEKRREA